VSNRSYLIIFTIILISSSTIYAMPPRPGIKLSAAEVETRAQLGIDIIKNPVRDIGKRGIYNTPGDVQPLVSGTKKFPVVCIKFPDYANTYGTANFDSMLFTDNWASGSAKKYYNDVSYSVFTLQGNVSSWYTSDNNKAYYGYSNGDARAAALAKEAATKADASIDYSLYDNDHDGYVDVFTCLHAGYGMEETSNGADIWSHSWSFSYAGIGVYTTYDPDPVNGGYIKIDDYVIDPEQSNYTNHGSMVCIGVFCHEWGHALGLPDLYDTSPYPYTAGEGLGNWCIMAAGSWGGDGNSPWKPVQMCAWAKMDLGWLNPTAVRSRGLYSIHMLKLIQRHIG
jgi:M6 family metalloprotease-like protein